MSDQQGDTTPELFDQFTPSQVQSIPNVVEPDRQKRYLQALRDAKAVNT